MTAYRYRSQYRTHQVRAFDHNEPPREFPWCIFPGLLLEVCSTTGPSSLGVSLIMTENASVYLLLQTLLSFIWVEIWNWATVNLSLELPVDSSWWKYLLMPMPALSFTGPGPFDFWDLSTFCSRSHWGSSHKCSNSEKSLSHNGNTQNKLVTMLTMLSIGALEQGP